MTLNGSYDFPQVSLIVGTRQIKGFEDGSEITAERDEDSFSKKVDVDGNVTRSKTNNSTGKITFTLSQFSEDNAYLQNLMNIDERTGARIVPVKLVDNSNPSLEIAIATEAWITKPWSKSFGRESGPREWVVDCANLNFLNSL